MIKGSTSNTQQWGGPWAVTCHNNTPLLCFLLLVMINIMRHFACVMPSHWHGIWWCHQGGWPHNWEAVPLSLLFPGCSSLAGLLLYSGLLALWGLTLIYSTVQEFTDNLLDCVCFLSIECQGVVFRVRQLGRCGSIIWFHPLVGWVLWSCWDGVLEFVDCVFHVSWHWDFQFSFLVVQLQFDSAV